VPSEIAQVARKRYTMDGKEGSSAGVEGCVTDNAWRHNDALKFRHIIGGNDVRLEPGLRFDPQKERKRPKLPRWVERLTVALCWPLMRRYGYPLGSGGGGGGPRAVPGKMAS
jgi:hypothetical protein